MSTTKRLRVLIDFSIEIADTPPPLAPGSIEPPDPEYDGRQARLLEAVKTQKRMPQGRTGLGAFFSVRVIEH